MVEIIRCRPQDRRFSGSPTIKPVCSKGDLVRRTSRMMLDPLGLCREYTDMERPTLFRADP